MGLVGMAMPGRAQDTLATEAAMAHAGCTNKKAWRFASPGFFNMSNHVKLNNQASGRMLEACLPLGP